MTLNEMTLAKTYLTDKLSYLGVISVGTAKKGNKNNLQIFYGNVLIEFDASHRSDFQNLSNSRQILLFF